MTTTPTKGRAQEAASTTAEEGRHVAEVAKEEAHNVAGEAAAQARNIVNETMTQVSDQVGEQSRTQRDRLVGTLQTLSDDLDEMASATTQSGLATNVVRAVAEQARSWSSALDGREPQELLDDVRRFARRRPGVFLFGALAAGVLAGRVARGAKQGAATNTSPGSGSSSSTPDPTAESTQPTPRVPAATAPIPAAPIPPTPPPAPAGYGQPGTTEEERPL